MGSPNLSDVYVSAPLTNLAIGYQNNLFVAKTIMPWLQVDEPSGIYYVFGRENLKRVDTTRAPRTESRQAGYSVSEETYLCKQHALHDLIPDEIQNAAKVPLQPKMNTTTNLTDLLLLEHEYKVANMLTDTAQMTNHKTVDGSAGWIKWSTVDTSDPFGNMEYAIQQIVKKAGRRPNVCIIGSEVMTVLKNHPDALDRIKYTQKGIVTADLIGSIISIPNTVEGSAVENTAAEGATEVLSYLWGKNVVFGFVNQTPAINAPSFGYTFSSSALGKINFSDGFLVKTWREEKMNSDAVEVATNYDTKITCLSAGYLLDACVA